MLATVPVGVWEDASFLDLCHPRVALLFRYWDGKRRGRRMPARRDVDPTEMRQWLGRLNLFDVFRNPLHFGFRLAGTDYVRLIGSDPTGRRFGAADDPPANPSSVTRALFEVVEQRSFRFWNHPAEPETSHFLGGERICLPFSENGEEVDMLLLYYAGLERLNLC